MHWQPTPFFLPLLLSALVSSALAAYAIRHWRARGAPGLAAVGICSAVWSLGYGLYGASTDPTMRWWLVLAIHIAAGAIPLAWLVAALEHTRRESWLQGWLFRLAVAAAGLPLLLALTNPLHGWFFVEFGVARNGGRVATVVEYGPAFWAHLVVAWLIQSTAVFILASRAMRTAREERERYVALVLAAAVPWLGNVVYFLWDGLFPANPMPFLFTVSGVILGWAIRRLRLMGVVPVARAALVEGMRDGVVVLNEQGVVVDLNPAARRILGVEEGRGVGEPGRRLLAVLDADGGDARRVAIRGRIYQVSSSEVGDRGSAGRLVVLGDVTELAQKSTELEAVFQALPDLYFRLDAEGRILESRAGAGEDVRPVGHGTGRRIAEVLPLSIAEPVMERLAEVRRTGALATVEYSHATSRGERDYEARLLPFGDDQVIVVVRDVTDRKTAERAIVRSEESYRGLFDSITELVYVQDLEGRFINVNAAVVRAYGYTREELLGQTPDILAEPARVDVEDTMARFARAVAGEPQRFEWWGRRKDGSSFPKELVLSRSTYFGRDAVIAVARDITERKQGEEALRQAKEDAEGANRAKSEFLSRMSHELRTPLNSILGFGQVLARHPLTPEQHNGVDHILRAGRHLLNLINEVLDIARIESGHQPLALEPVRAAAVVQEALTLIRPVAAQHGCTLRSDVDPGSELLVEADPRRLTQVLLNLLSNAVKYNRPGGEVQVTWDVDDSESDAPRVRIAVRDSGPGIAPEHLDLLFVPFARLGAEESEVEGTGLGLALSRPLIEAMGGSIRVQSVLGEGSTFTVELPLARAGDAAAIPPPDGEAPAAAPPDGVAQATVLYIEDNVANVSLVEAILEERPEITLLSALRGRPGVEMAAEHRPDLILLDLHLPDMPGQEVLRRLAEDPLTRGIPVIVISADATGDTVARLLESGASAYITKPLDLGEFMDAVDGALGMGRGAD